MAAWLRNQVFFGNGQERRRMFAVEPSCSRALPGAVNVDVFSNAARGPAC